MSRRITQREIIRMKCDNCDIVMEFDSIEVKCGFGSAFDGKSFDFCCETCLMEFYNKNFPKKTVNSSLDPNTSKEEKDE